MGFHGVIAEKQLKTAAVFRQFFMIFFIAKKKKQPYNDSRWKKMYSKSRYKIELVK